jgi:hypothetical protein
MLVAIHQPHYLPWLGYLHRMARADLFIMLDHVQFERGNYQNRTQVRVNGAPHWLTVPVQQRSQKERILDKAIDNTKRWGLAHFETLRRAYVSAGFFGTYAADLRAILDCDHQRLVDLNEHTLDFLRHAFDIRTPLVKSSEIAGVEGAKSELVLNLCKAVGASGLLVGLGGSRNYLDRGAFAKAGIALEMQEFTHPVYNQRGGGVFNPGLSALDLLFNYGPAAGRILFGTKSELRFAA